MLQSEIVEFPGLGLSFALRREAFSIGGFSVYWYGILMAAAFLLGAMYCLRQARAFGLDADAVLDVLMFGAVGGVIGARIYYVAFNWDTYRDNLGRIFAIREGGMAVYGGIIGGILVAWVFCRRKKVPFLPGMDAVSGGFFLGQAIGRWGNFVNIEAFGGNTTLPWGMTSERTIPQYLASHRAQLAALGITVDPNVPVHPTFFYEFLWCILGFLIIALALNKRRRFDGQLILFYLMWYGAGRFVIEGLRTDSLMAGGMRVSQLVALLCVLFALAATLLMHARLRRGGPGGLPLHTAHVEAPVSVSPRALDEEQTQARQDNNPASASPKPARQNEEE